MIINTARPVAYLSSKPELIRPVAERRKFLGFYILVSTTWQAMPYMQVDGLRVLFQWREVFDVFVPVQNCMCMCALKRRDSVARCTVRIKKERDVKLVSNLKIKRA